MKAYIFLAILAVASFSAATEEERDAGLKIKLPGGQFLLNADFSGVEKYLRERFVALGLTIEDQDRLIAQYQEFIKELPKISPLDILKLGPIKFAKTVEYITVRIGEFVANVLHEAEQLVRHILVEKRAIRLPGLADIVDHYREHVGHILDELTGLTSEQRGELINEFLQKLRDFPNEKKLHTLKPSQIAQYLKDVKDYVDEVVVDVVAKAKQYIEHNKSENRKRALEIPAFIKSLHERLINAFKTAIYTISGLTHEQQDELVDDFKNGILATPLPEFSLNPLNWVKYIAELTKHNIQLTKDLLNKAKDMLKGEHKDRRALSLNSLIDEAISQFKKLLSSVSGLTPEETEELIKEFKDHLDTFPVMPIGDWFKPDKVFQYLKDIRTFTLKLTSMLLEKAKAIVDFRLHGGKETREIAFPSIQTILEKVAATFRKALDAVGLTKEKTDRIYEEFVDFINSFPQIKPSEFLSPSKIAEYAKRLIKFGQDAVEAFLEKAKAAINFERSERDISFEIQIPDLIGKARIPDFSKLLESVKTYVAQLGLSADEEKFLLHRLELELKNYPRPPSGLLEILNPLRWLEYLSERSGFVKNVVLKAIKDAEDYAIKKNGTTKKPNC